MQSWVDADWNSGDDKGGVADNFNVNFFARYDVPAGYLPVLIFHDNSLARSDLRMKSYIGNINVVARLNQRVFSKGGADIIISENFHSFRARDTASYVDVASSDFRAVYGAVNFNVAGCRYFKAWFDIAADCDCAVEFNIARRNADWTFYN